MEKIGIMNNSGEIKMKIFAYILILAIIVTNYVNGSELLPKTEENRKILSDEYSLYQLFKKQPYSAGTIPREKIALINALGKYDSNYSVEFLTKLLEEYLKKEPVYKKYIHEDKDYSSVINTIFRALSKNEKAKDSKNLEALLNKLVSQNTSVIKQKYGWKLSWKEQESAYMLKISFETLGKNKKEKVDWLISNLSDMPAGKKEHWLSPGVKSLVAIKNGAIFHLLIQAGKDASLPISNELKKASVSANKKMALRLISSIIESEKKSKPISPSPKK